MQNWIAGRSTNTSSKRIHGFIQEGRWYGRERKLLNFPLFISDEPIEENVVSDSGENFMFKSTHRSTFRSASLM